MNTLKSFIYKKIIPCIGQICIRNNRYINVIYYHDVVNGNGETYMRINIDRFKQHMLYLKSNGYQTYTFQDLNNRSLEKWKKKHILITFDDGWLSNYNKIYDFMKSNGIKYNIFLETAKIGKNPEYLSWKNVREMYNSGLVGFGAHTYSHPNMSKLDGLDLNLEIDHANELIQKELGFIPEDFCFPYGAYSQEVIDSIIKMGTYRRIYTSDLRYTYSQQETLIFGRNAISDTESLKVFKNKAAGKYNVLNSLFKFK